MERKKRIEKRIHEHYRLLKQPRRFACLAMKREDGAMTDLLPPMIMLLAVAVIMVAFMGMCSLINLNENVKQAARASILEMETKGYLETAEENRLLSSLRTLGMENISLAGSTKTPVGYGRDIHLYISGNLKASSLNSSRGDLLRYYFENRRYPVSLHLTSTAKH